MLLAADNYPVGCNGRQHLWPSCVCTNALIATPGWAHLPVSGRSFDGLPVFAFPGMGARMSRNGQTRMGARHGYGRVLDECGCGCGCGVMVMATQQQAAQQRAPGSVMGAASRNQGLTPLCSRAAASCRVRLDLSAPSTCQRLAARRFRTWSWHHMAGQVRGGSRAQPRRRKRNEIIECDAGYG